MYVDQTYILIPDPLIHLPYCTVMDVASGTEKVGALVQGYMQLMKYGYIYLFEQGYMNQTVRIGISVTSGTAMFST